MENELTSGNTEKALKIKNPVKSDGGVVRCENSYSEQICSKLYLDEETADVHFIFGTGDSRMKIPAHKMLLAKGSDVFHKMFYGDFKKPNEIEVVDVSADAFKCFLQYFYLNAIDLSMNHIEELMYLADFYMTKKFYDICVPFLRDNSKTRDICLIDDLAIKYELPNLKAFCELKIREDLPGIFASDAFHSCSYDVLKHILSIKVQNCDHKSVFDACMAWSMQKCLDDGLDVSIENRRMMLDDVIQLIPLGRMSSTQIYQCIAESTGFFNQKELEDIILLTNSPFRHANLLQFKTFLSWKEFTREPISDECLYIMEKEYMFLETTKKIVLCAISAYELSLLYHEGLLNGLMTIEKKSSQDPFAAGEIVLKQQVEISNRSYIMLDKDFVLEPGVLYGITICFDPNLIDSLKPKTHGKISSAQINLGEDFNINFAVKEDHNSDYDFACKYYYKDE